MEQVVIVTEEQDTMVWLHLLEQPWQITLPKHGVHVAVILLGLQEAELQGKVRIAGITHNVVPADPDKEDQELLRLQCSDGVLNGKLR